MFAVLLMLFASVKIGEGVPEIKLFIIRNESAIDCPREHIQSPKLNWRKQFKLSVLSDVTIIDGECSSGYEHHSLQTFNKDTHTGLYVYEKILDVNIMWTGSIACKFRIENSKEVVCNFLGDIREQDLGYSEVNGMEVKMEQSSETDHFDKYGYYDCFEGELVAISCHSTSTDNIQLVYTSVDENITTILETKMNNEVSSIFYIKFSEKNNDSIDCIFTDYLKTKSLITRILFKKSHVPDIGFTVNGLRLSRFKSTCEQDCLQYYKYFYEYYDNEKLVIKSYKSLEYNEMSCTTNATNEVPSELSFNNTKLTDIQLTTSLGENSKEVVITCQAKNIHLFKDAKISLRLTPWSDSEYRPTINGISKAKISKIYRTADKHNMIYYEYDDTLPQLQCNSNKAVPKWEFDVTEVEGIVNNASYFDNSNIYKTMGNFTLKQGVEHSVIKCKAPSKTEGTKQEYNVTEIKLLKRKDNHKISTSNGFVEINEKSEDSDLPTHSDIDPSDKADPNGSWRNKLIVIGGVSGTMLLVIALMIFIIIRISKRKPEQIDENQTNINYENLPIHNHGVTPTPKQCDGTYSEPSDFTHRNNRNAPGNNHNAPGNNHNAPENNYTGSENNYAVPYAPKSIEELYTTPIPKNERNFNINASKEQLNPVYPETKPKSKIMCQAVKVLPSVHFINSKLNMTQNKETPNFDSPYVDMGPNSTSYLSKGQKQISSPVAGQSESPYAEVGHSESPYAEVGHSESPYAEVGHSESPYAEVGQTGLYAEPNVNRKIDYANLFNSKRYVNANGKDYAEPAYCEK